MDVHITGVILNIAGSFLPGSVVGVGDYALRFDFEVVWRGAFRGRLPHGVMTLSSVHVSEDVAADEGSDLGDDGVAEAGKAVSAVRETRLDERRAVGPGLPESCVQSRGNPIIHSTKVGLRRPPCSWETVSFRGREFLSVVVGLAWEDFQSRAEGVGSWRARVVRRFVPPSRP